MLVLPAVTVNTVPSSRMELRTCRLPRRSLSSTTQFPTSTIIDLSNHSRLSHRPRLSHPPLHPRPPRRDVRTAIDALHTTPLHYLRRTLYLRPYLRSAFRGGDFYIVRNSLDCIWGKRIADLGSPLVGIQCDVFPQLFPRDEVTRVT